MQTPEMSLKTMVERYEKAFSRDAMVDGRPTMAFVALLAHRVIKKEVECMTYEKSIDNLLISAKDILGGADEAKEDSVLPKD